MGRQGESSWETIKLGDNWTECCVMDSFVILARQQGFMNIETQGLDFLCQYKKAITTTKGNENATQKGNIKNIIEKIP